jgi:hypothetical protein
MVYLLCVKLNAVVEMSAVKLSSFTTEFGQPHSWFVETSQRECQTCFCWWRRLAPGDPPRCINLWIAHSKYWRRYCEISHNTAFCLMDGIQPKEPTTNFSIVLCFDAPLLSGVPRNFVREGGSTNSVEDRGQRERGSGGSSPLARGSGGSCNLVQEISFHIVKLS